MDIHFIMFHMDFEDRSSISVFNNGQLSTKIYSRKRFFIARSGV
jgi:hypothetical protein